jgi:hypothetical protein
MRFAPSIAAALIGLSSLVMPTIALSATEANSLYALVMAKAPEERATTLRTLNKEDRIQLLISRINAYRAAKDLRKPQEEILDESIELLQSGGDPSTLKHSAAKIFGFEEFKALMTTLDDFDAPPTKRSVTLSERGNCECSRNSDWCWGSESCSHHKPCTTQYNECGTFGMYHCTGLCLAL